MVNIEVLVDEIGHQLKQSESFRIKIRRLKSLKHLVNSVESTQFLRWEFFKKRSKMMFHLNS